MNDEFQYLELRIPVSNDEEAYQRWLEEQKEKEEIEKEHVIIVDI